MMYNNLLSEDDYVVTVEEFRQAVGSGFFRDYDGYGHPVKDGKMTNVVIVPSRVHEIPDDATHIVWFNR
jgi:hypothetical protein